LRHECQPGTIKAQAWDYPLTWAFAVGWAGIAGGGFFLPTPPQLTFDVRCPGPPVLHHLLAQLRHQREKLVGGNPVAADGWSRMAELQSEAG
jgi:hypothetical protein